ncbi:MAG: hypothetical protein J5J06_05480 [Phycisphaerae bacterium]|nr:hypothetical protein [Phycisphaerae bacterium]
MITRAIQQCPRCSGALDREHVAAENVVNGEITYLYCDFCGVGWETWWELGADGRLHERLTATYDRTRPEPLAKFLKNLESARAA